MSVQVSRLLRIALEDRFALNFNDNLQVACDDFGITDLVYKINFDQPDGNTSPDTFQPQNFYRDSWTLEDLISFREPELPALAMWTGEGNQYGPGQREMPRVFSGFVFAHWRFFLAVQGGRKRGLTYLREATESAMIQTLATEFNEVNYKGDIGWDNSPGPRWEDISPDHSGFTRIVDFHASFEVNV